MPSNISRGRRQKAFDEGRRSATTAVAENPYDNPTLRRLWEEGRAQQQAGTIDAPIPPLAHGETRAQRHPRNPPKPKAPPRRPPPRYGGRGGPPPGR